MREFIGSLLGILVSILATSCCIAPTLFVVFGVSVGSLSFLSILEPYRWHFLTVAYLTVRYSFYRLYLKKWIETKILKKSTCICEEPNLAQKISRGTTWIALILLIVATFYPYVLEKIYGG